MARKSLFEILQLPPIEWLVEGILPKGGVLVLGGPPKKGKSRLVLNEMLNGAQGNPIFGRFEAETLQPLIFNAEGGHEGIRARAPMFAGLGAYLNWIEVEDEHKPLVDNLGNVDMKTYDAMAKSIEGHNLFVVDPLIRFHAVDENDNQKMDLVLNTLQALTKATNSTCLIVHHTSKLPDDMTVGQAKKHGGMKLRGASSLFGAVDGAIMAYPVDGGRLSLTFSLRYAGDPGEVVMVPCACLAPEDGCGRFYLQVQGPQRALVGEPRAWVKDHPNAPQGLYAKAFKITQSVAEEVLGSAA